MRTSLAAAVLVAVLAAGEALAQTPDRVQIPHPGAPASAVRGAIVDSLKIVLIEHGIRIAAQQKTRDALKGPFFADYVDSLRVPRQWEDGDAWWVNYIGHPIHGAAAGYVWLDHDRGAPADISLRSV
jgi:hypothetical protein